MGAAGNEQPPSRMCKAMVWPWVASRLVLPKARGTLLWLMMVGQMSASSEPDQLIGAELAAVTGFGQSGLAE